MKEALFPAVIIRRDFLLPAGIALRRQETMFQKPPALAVQK